MRDDKSRLAETEKRKFLHLLTAMHPEKMGAVDQEEEPVEEDVIEDENMPFSVTEMEQMARDFQTMGLSMS